MKQALVQNQDHHMPLGRNPINPDYERETIFLKI